MSELDHGRIVIEGAGMKANIRLKVLAELPGQTIVTNFHKGEVELHTAFGRIFFKESDRRAMAAYLRRVADSCDDHRGE